MQSLSEKEKQRLCAVFLYNHNFINILFSQAA